MAIANITNNILTDSGVATSSLLPLAGGTLTGTLNGTNGVFSSSLQSSGYYLTGMTAGSGALYYNSTENRVTLANYNSGGILNFEVNGGTYAMRINANGNVGIGTSSSSYKLSVQGSNASDMISWTDAINNTGYLGIRTGGIVWMNADNNLAFGTGNTERMRITSGGNVGIGTSSPTGLSVATNLIVKGATDKNGYIQALSGDGASSVALYSGSYSGDNPSLIFQNSLRFGTATDSGTTSYTERMRITSGGNVGIGTTNVTGRFVVSADDTQYVLRSQNASGGNPNQFYIQHSLGNVVIGNDRGIVTYGSISDYRLKEDLQDYNALNIIGKLKTYDFKWKESGVRDYGVIAHEMQEILPNYVTRGKDAINEDGTIKAQSVDYSKLVPVLVKAIQEQQAQIEELKALIANK